MSQNSSPIAVILHTDRTQHNKHQQNQGPYDWNMTSLAELGFIVVMVDGMGTSFRSRAFENVCYKNLKDAGLPDHIAWMYFGMIVLLL